MKSVLLLIACLFNLLVASAQKPTSDVILKLNGEEMVGKVIEINDDNIKFNYKDEAISYTIKKSDILKITFASGRIEIFNKPSLPSEANSNAAQRAENGPGLESHHNKIAILPFKFLIDKQAGDEDLGFTAQSEAFAFLERHSAGLTLQDVNTTNSLLAKAGINNSNIRSFTPADICAALGVEFVVQSTVTINKGSLSTRGSGSGSATVKQNQGKSGNDTKVNSYGSNYSSTTQEYESSVLLNIYNDTGNTLYNESRKAFFSGQDNYKNALQYLLKRSPVYRK